jgi:hypothetical protein
MPRLDNDPPPIEATVLMISPLNMLTQQQVRNIPKGAKGLALTHDKNNLKHMRRIVAREYSYSRLILSRDLLDRILSRTLLPDCRLLQLIL